MLDPRNTQLANLLIDYSTKVKSGDKVHIMLHGIEGMPLLREVYRVAVSKGAVVDYEIRDYSLTKAFYDVASEEQISYCSPLEIERVKENDVFIRIYAESNKMELAQIDQAKLLANRKARKEVLDTMINKRWVLLEYPTAGGAQDAKMSLEDWEDFVFSSCLMDWEKAGREQDVIKNLMEQTKIVRIVADGTDISFDISGQKAIKCCGSHNMPDGEVFTAPLRNGVNGTILFNTPTIYMGKDFNWIELTFQDGKVIAAKADQNQEDLENILNTDDGARYLGEFAFGLNRGIKKPVKSILFDEKIGGSNHMALGKCYDEAPNGNDSAIHWDLIIRHKEAHGSVYMDDVLVQEHGVWVHPNLVQYN